jgi:hypothetical protein
MTDPRSAKPRPSAPGERPIKDLSQVNEKLRELVASLKSARERHDGAAEAAPPPRAAAAAARPAATGEELRAAHDAAAAAAAERDALKERFDRLEAEVGRISDEYVLVQEQTSEMAQLYVALERLHGGLTRAETLQALQEIVINLVGSEELAVFEQVDDRLQLVHHFGVDPVPLRELKLGDGVIGKAAATGRPFVAGRDGPVEAGDADVSAVIPLLVGAKVWGALAIFRLLGHKPVLGDTDHVVFELIRNHAGLALFLRRDGAAS